MPTELQLIGQIASLDTMGTLKSASLPNDDIADYALLNLAMLKAIEEKTATSTVSFLAAALGRRNSATALTVVKAQKRLVSTTITRPATTPTYASGQTVADVANGSQLTMLNFFGATIASGTSVNIKKIALIRQVAAGTLANANYRIVTCVNSGFASVTDAAVLAPTVAQAQGIQSIATLNMTSISPRLQYGEIILPDSTVISPGSQADAYAAIVNLGAVVALPSETFQLTYFIED
jgi:hypothetical protein